MDALFHCPMRWEDLSPVSSGLRHCSVCDRLVADLSFATEDEARRWLELQGGPACVKGFVDAHRRLVLQRAAVVGLVAAGVAAAVALGTCEPEPVMPFIGTVF